MSREQAHTLERNAGREQRAARADYLEGEFDPDIARRAADASTRRLVGAIQRKPADGAVGLQAEGYGIDTEGKTTKERAGDMDMLRRLAPHVQCKATDFAGAETATSAFPVEGRTTKQRAGHVAMLKHLGVRPLQQKPADAPTRSPDAMRAVAAAGIATPARPLPHADKIQAAFGPQHDVSQIRAHIDPESTRAIGAEAYATGNDIVFAKEPDVETAAHEATHVVQQAQGVSLKGGVGEAGDAYEQVADAVGARVRAGQSAADLLPTSSSGGGANSTTAVQRKPKQDDVIEMPEEYVGKPDIEMPEEYVGKPDIEMPDDYVGKPRLVMEPEYVGKPGKRVLAEFVERTEKEVAALAKALDKAASPEAVVSAACQRILAGFAELEHALNHSRVNGYRVYGLMQRLDTALGKLFTLARQHQVPLRETGLEEVFDREDNLRLRREISFEGRANRADQYYDADFGGAQQHRGPAPDASTIADDIDKGTPTSEPKNRADLIRDIKGLESQMWFALDHAFKAASAVINEPEMPKDPSTLEQLAAVAAGILMTQANVALGGILDAAAKSATVMRGLAKTRSALRERVGRDTAKALMAGFAAGAKATVMPTAKVGIQHVTKPAPKAPPEEAQEEFDPEKLDVSPKQIYLLKAHRRTTAAKVETSKQFADYEPTLRRLPVETLRDLIGAFNEMVFTDVANRFRDLLVQEWVNFVKRASDMGYQMRDVATRKREFGMEQPGPLAQVMWPAGVVHIRVVLQPDGRVAFRDAVLPGVSGPVWDRITRMNKPLSSLAMYRRIELVAPNAVIPPGGTFDVDTQGAIERLNVHGPARGALAAVAHPVRAVVFDENDVIAGALALMQKLSMYTTRAIKRFEQ